MHRGVAMLQAWVWVGAGAPTYPQLWRRCHGIYAEIGCLRSFVNGEFRGASPFDEGFGGVPQISISPKTGG